MSVTLSAVAQFELEVRKSRFLVHAAPVSDADAAMAWLAAHADRAATHNCWAWRVGAQYRSSDDGEPAGTAGRPILAAIDGQGFDRVAVQVTRWYGGIKLGAGGLVRAYGGAAAECLRRAPRVPIVIERTFALHCTFAQLGSVHALLATHAAVKLSEDFVADGVELRARLRADALQAFASAVRDATRGRVTIRPE